MNIKDIARLAGVSVSTVSKVMNRKDGTISQETREKVLKIARDYNYTPYASVMTPSGKTFLIGVLLRSSTVRTTLNGILERARELGYGVLISDSGSSLEGEKKALSSFFRSRVDAVLWEAFGPESLQNASELEKAGIPCLFFNCSLPGALNLDYQGMGYEAARLLIEKGHQDIACLLSPGSRTDALFEGYRKCLFEHQLPFREELVFHGITPALLHRLAGHGATAVLCSHFASALELYERGLILHCKTPEDFSLLSLRDDGRLKTPFPDISSFAIPHRQFGRFLCEQLIRLTEREENDGAPVQPETTVFSWLPEPDSLSTIGLPFSMLPKKMAVVGSSNVDIYLKVAQLPSSGRVVRTPLTAQYAGGKGLNQAVGAAKLGHRVSLITAVGSDAEADMLCEALHEHSVESSGIRKNNSLPTGRAYIFVEPGGESMITILSGANDALRPEDLKNSAHLFKDAAYTLVSTEIPMETVEEACLLTKSQGGETILKPATCGPLKPELLRLVDILVPNLEELNEICPGTASTEEKASELLRQGARTVIVTLGGDGCLLCSPEGIRRFPASDFPAIDNTGAGDAFISALASYLLYGFDLEHAIQIAGYAAGFCITREGVVPSLIDKSTLETYLQQKAPRLLTPSGCLNP